MDINVIKNLIQKQKYTVIYIFFFYGTMSYGLMTLLNHIVGDDLAINYGLKMLYPLRIQHFDFWAIGQKVLMKIAMRIENSMSMAI